MITNTAIGNGQQNGLLVVPWHWQIKRLICHGVGTIFTLFYAIDDVVLNLPDFGADRNLAGGSHF